MANTEKKPCNLLFIIYDNNKCFLVLVIYISLLYFISYFFQKAENNRLKKKPVGQNFVILFLFFLK